MWVNFYMLWMTLCLMLPANCLKIGSFNIQIFGKAKADREKVMTILSKILQRYDIVLIMEIRDIKGTAIQKLLNLINRNRRHPFSIIISDRLGRTFSKEQYAFLYRPSSGLHVTGSYHYDDGDEKLNNDTFQREPFIIHLQSEKTVISEFTLIALHTEPQQSVKELMALLDVHDDVLKKWQTGNIIIMGDLNADCAYVSKKDWPNILVRQMKQFYWPISDDTDTTVGTTDCAYDRFIVSGEKLIRSIIRKETKVFEFQKEFHLTQTEALAVSDHYPIEMVIAETVRLTTNRTKQLLPFMSIALTTVTFTIFVTSHCSYAHL